MLYLPIMKKGLSLLLFIFVVSGTYAQYMQIKKPNLTGFAWAERFVTPVLDTMSSDKAKQHPEYGVLPYNSQCSQCVELIDKRTINTRFFVDPYVPYHIFSQKSYFPLHYQKNANDIWRTIDHRLKPDTLHRGVYVANQQPVPTKCDLNRKSTSLTAGGLEFEFNKNLTLHFEDEGVVSSKAEPSNYSNYTIGQQGLEVKDIWPGIDMQQVFSIGEVKTSYTIPKPLQVPISHGYMVIEDHFTVPDGYTFEEANRGQHPGSNEFIGDFYLKDKNGNTLITYARPVYIDLNAVGLPGIYKLIRNGNDYTLQTLIPVKWLNRVENVYPLTIDPIVSGDSAWGNFIATGLASANLAFTSVALGFCDYHMSVTVPGMSQLTNAFVNIEYKLTYSDSCGHPPEPAPYCLFTQVRQYLLNDSCRDTYRFSCPSIGDTTGTCTTDSFHNGNIFHPQSPAAFTAGQLLPCYAPQCPDYDLGFTLKNTDSICGDVCGYLCARGSMWEMTIEACTVNGSITQNKTRVCAGQSAIFTADPNCGVPPYHYVWTPDGGNTFDTIFGTPEYVVTTSDALTTEDSVYITCYIIDTCGNMAATNILQLNIIPSPKADAGPDHIMCRGGATVTLGGNPTTNNGANTVWTGSTPTVQSWLNSTTATNPSVTVPAGTVDTFFYALKTTNTLCFNTDTVYIFSTNGGQVSIDSGGATKICAGAGVKLIAQGGPFVSYQWSNGGASSSIFVSQGGGYFVIVRDSLGCMDTSNVINITTTGPPSVHAFPDTTIQVGDSVTLYSDLNLNASSIDSFFWSPFVSLSCSTCANPRVAPAGSQTYNLVVYSDGCEVSASVLVQVILPDNFYIPNVFTPNGDGNNDLFYIEYQSGVTVLQFQVFDRWGEKVHDGLYPWDGNYKGKPAPQAVYVYVFKLQLYGHDVGIMRKGSVTLLR